MAENLFGKAPYENTDEANFLEQTADRSVRCASQAFLGACIVIFLMKGGIINVLTAKNVTRGILLING